MKLLSWMRAIKQNGDFCCLRAQVPTQVQDIRTNSFSFSGPSNPPVTEEELWFEEDGFCGFLAIGTLGTDAETPKFSASVEEDNVCREEREMAKLITEKLDKFLEDTSSSKQVERSKAQGDRESNVQGSSVELTKRSNGGMKKKKGLLTSLFKTVEGACSMEKHGTRDLIKTIFEKLHRCCSKNDDSMPKMKDLRKSVQIFPSKVHPVLSTPSRYDSKVDDIRSCISHRDLKVPTLTGGFIGSSSISQANRKRENWIKTDAEYLVLEL